MTQSKNDTDHSFYYFVMTFLVVALSSAYLLSKIKIPDIAWQSLLVMLGLLVVILGLAFIYELIDDLEILALIIGLIITAYSFYRVLRHLINIDFFVVFIQAIFIILFSILLLLFLSRLLHELDVLIKFAPVVIFCLTLVYLIAQSDGLFYSSLASVSGALLVYFLMKKKHPQTGPERLAGTIGTALVDFVRKEPKTTEYYSGTVKLGNVIWKARSQMKLYKDDPIIVLELWERLTLNVGPRDPYQEQPFKLDE